MQARLCSITLASTVPTLSTIVLLLVHNYVKAVAASSLGFTTLFRGSLSRVALLCVGSSVTPDLWLGNVRCLTIMSACDKVRRGTPVSHCAWRS